MNAQEEAAIVNEMVTIPHLTLPEDYDLAGMVKEVEQIDDYSSYQSIYGPDDAFKSRYRNIWKGRSLTNYASRDSREGMREITRDELAIAKRGETVETELAAQCPIIMSAVKFLGGNVSRCRIMTIAPGTSLDWHRHSDAGQPDNSFTVHLPLITPDNFTFEVTTADNIKDKKIINRDLSIKAEYPLGKATVFNSYHWHNVFNPGNFARVSVMMYCSLKHTNFRAQALKALDTYTGPRLQEDKP